MKNLESKLICPGKVEGAEALAAELEAILQEVRDAVGELGLVSLVIEEEHNAHIHIEAPAFNPALGIDHAEELDTFDIDAIHAEMKRGGRLLLVGEEDHVQRALQVTKQIVAIAKEQNPSYAESTWHLLTHLYPHDQKRERGWHVDGWTENEPTDPVHVQFTFGNVAGLEVVEGSHEVESEEALRKMEFSDTSSIPDFTLVEIGNHLIHRVEDSGKTGLRKVIVFV